MTRIKRYLILSVLLITCLFGAVVIRYQQKIETKDKTIKKQKETIKKLKNKNQDLTLKVIDLKEEKDCSWLENFYYNHREDGKCQCGVYEKENGYIIDGAWYEYKGEYKELFGE